MPYPFHEVNGRRVCCGRCRHTSSQERMEDGPFDSETGLTFYCQDCHAVYAVCRLCGWFMSDGASCAGCELIASFIVTTRVEPRCRLSVQTWVERRGWTVPAWAQCGSLPLPTPTRKRNK